MDLIKVYFDDKLNLVFEISIWVLGTVLLLAGIYLVLIRKWLRYELVKVDIKLGNVGVAEFRPNKNDLQIAHKIWTELVTRKAAIPIDKEHDVIEDIYDSWYAMFQKVREFISDIPAHLIRSNQSTKEIVRISTKTLNDGLRPHLTKWQAKFRTWSDTNKEKLKEMTPQELQRKYPEYKDLIEDLMRVNEQLIQYSQELKKIIDK
jgi:hypothetical protein